MKNTGNIALIICLALSVYLFTDKMMGAKSKKIGVIQMDKLVYDFKGMKEATDKYSSRLKGWNQESDSLESRLKELYNQIRVDSANKDHMKLDQDIKVFMIFKQSYMEHMQTLQANAEKEDKQMTIGVVNQVNEYIKSYAKAEAYDVVLCNTQEQSVAYAKDRVDITQQVLEYANKQYEGVK
jgi:Skp family chaperone for outer membrane proteins